MNPDDQARIAEVIDTAYALAERKADAAAAQAFALARSMCTALPVDGELDRKVHGQITALTREREQYRALIAAQRTTVRTMLVLSDSLGLPRPDDKGGEHLGAERTYPMLLLDRLPEHSVQSYCQRYYTMADIAALLDQDPDLGRDADVVVHIGLNDCASRMFLERERLSLDLLPAEVKDRIVAYAQRYRRQILAHLPSHHYVAPDEFRVHLDTICTTLQSRGARRIALTTIILPPIKFWPATPGVQRNFGRYNQMIMDAAARHDVRLFDLDRHVWARQHEGVLLPDGMHLSLAGHQLFADELAALIR